MPSKIVVHFKDNKMLKGTVADFYTNKSTFHLKENKTGRGHVVEMDKLKAIFFVRSFEGQKNRKRKKGFIKQEKHGLRTVVKFHDGEVMYGYSQDYHPTSRGFFLFIADPESNNTKVFIPNASVLDIKLGEDIDKSQYADVSPKFLKKIVPKVIKVSMQITVGKFPLHGAQIKFPQSSGTHATSEDGKLELSLKPGKHEVLVIYGNYTIKKDITVDKSHTSFVVDLQKESH